MRYFLTILILSYRIMSPGLHLFMSVFGAECRCKYPVTCSSFALEEISGRQNIFIALRNIASRFISCGPWPASLRRN